MSVFKYLWWSPWLPIIVPPINAESDHHIPKRDNHAHNTKMKAHAKRLPKRAPHHPYH